MPRADYEKLFGPLRQGELELTRDSRPAPVSHQREDRAIICGVELDFGAPGALLRATKMILELEGEARDRELELVPAAHRWTVAHLIERHRINSNNKKGG